MNKKKVITALILTLLLVSLFSVSASAADIYGTEEVKNTNIFDTVYGMILENSDKILSALAFASSVCLVLVYKRGLLPILKNALSGLGSAVSKLKEESEKSSETASESINAAAQKLGEAEKAILSLSEKLSELESKLSLTANLQSDAEKLRTLTSCQIDMLYEVFMSSSLPAYRKESIGEKIAEMRRTMAEEKPTKEVSCNEGVKN